MNIKQNPFSLYDFLGYIIPGSVFLIIAIALFFHSNEDSGLIQLLTMNLSLDKTEAYIFFIISSYIVGHFLSFLSSLFIEKYSIWAHDYPSKFLLGYSHKGYFNGTEKLSLRIITRVILAIIVAPISILDFTFGRLLGMYDLYRRPLDPLLRKLIRAKITHLIKHHANLDGKPFEVKAKDVDFFRYVYHFAVENAPNHLYKMQNYVALYGFLRTLTFISLTAFWSTTFHIFYNPVDIAMLYGLLLLSGITTYIFFMAYIKFFRRFSLEAFMAMAVTYTPQMDSSQD